MEFVIFLLSSNAAEELRLLSDILGKVDDRIRPDVAGKLDNHYVTE